MDLIEIIVFSIPQNGFIEMLNKTCVIEPSDSSEEILDKKKKFVALMMMRVKKEIAELAKEDPYIKSLIDEAEAFKNHQKEQESANRFVENCRQITKRGEE